MIIYIKWNAWELCCCALTLLVQWIIIIGKKVLRGKSFFFTCNGSMCVCVSEFTHTAQTCPHKKLLALFSILISFLFVSSVVRVRKVNDVLRIWSHCTHGNATQIMNVRFKSVRVECALKHEFGQFLLCHPPFFGKNKLCRLTYVLCPHMKFLASHTIHWGI